MPTMRRVVPATSSGCPAPIWLLTSVLAVEANELTMTKTMPDTLRMMFVTASGRSPRCSTAMKKRNHVEMATNIWIIVHTETFSMSRSSLGENPAKRNSPYLR